MKYIYILNETVSQLDLITKFYAFIKSKGLKNNCLRLQTSLIWLTIKAEKRIILIRNGI